MIQSANELRNAQGMDQPETLLGCHFRLKAQGPLLPIRAHVVEHHKEQPPQPGCNERGLQTGDPPLLQLRHIRNHIDAPAATDDTAVSGMAEEFEVTDFEQENPVAELDNLSNGGKTIYDIGKLNSPPHSEEDRSPGTINSHQGIPGKALGQILSKPTLPTAIPTKGAKEMLDLGAKDVTIETKNKNCCIIYLTCSKTEPKVQSTSHRYSTSCHSPARPPEDDTDGPAPEGMSNMSARFLATTTGKATAIYRAASRKPSTAHIMSTGKSCHCMSSGTYLMPIPPSQHQDLVQRVAHGLWATH